MQPVAKVPVTSHDSWRYKYSVVAPKSSAVRCSLFGPSDPGSTRQLLDDAISADQTRVARCLNFDVANEMPIDGDRRYEWSRERRDDVPNVYRPGCPTKKIPATRETNTDAIRRLKIAKRESSCSPKSPVIRRSLSDVLKPILVTPNKNILRPSSAPIDELEVTPMKSILRSSMHNIPQPSIKLVKPVLFNSSLSRCVTRPEPVSLRSPTTSDAENEASPNTVTPQTPTNIQEPDGTPKSRILKQPKITDLIARRKTRSHLSKTSRPTQGRKRTRRSLSMDSAKKPKLTTTETKSDSQ